MGPITAVSLYLVAWWIVFLAVLPHGSQNYHQTGETPPPGVDPGVPVNPRMGRKVLITTAIAAVVWGIMFAIVQFKLIGLPPVAQTY